MRTSAEGYTYRNFSIPNGMADGLDKWINLGVLPGSFLTAILCNDLMGACKCADERNLENIPAYCAYLYNEAPPQCYGSRQRVEDWIKFKRSARIESGHSWE